MAFVACLLADLELLSGRGIPRGAKWWSDEEVRDNGLFDVWESSLGRWEDRRREGQSGFNTEVGYVQEVQCSMEYFAGLDIN